MRALIKSLFSTDVDVETFQPEDGGEFSVLLTLAAGPENGEGEEYFYITVCTPDFLKNMIEDGGVYLARHYLFVKRYDWPKIKAYIERFVSQCDGDDWNDVARKLSRLGAWEFEDYKESVD